MEKDWDLNIYFLEEYDEETDEYVNSKTIKINPVLWMHFDDGRTDVEYSNWYIETTFAETRYIRAEYPADEYGDDWTDSLHNFMKIAPPRLASLLGTLPNAEEMTVQMVKDLVG
jgi:hypothetical protein